MASAISFVWIQRTWQLNKLKKGELVKAAEKPLSGLRWLPGRFRPGAQA